MAWVWPSGDSKQRPVPERSSPSPRPIPKHSERQEHDFFKGPPNLTLVDAPFGNNATPNVTSKIIGSKLVPVIESRPYDYHYYGPQQYEYGPPAYDIYGPSYNYGPTSRDYGRAFRERQTQSEYGKRIQPLDSVAIKPTQIDPRDYLTPEAYTKLHQSPPLHPGAPFDEELPGLSPRPTGQINYRPDSKDVHLGSYNRLPPIQVNRTKNDMSTVFEPEPWTHQTKPGLSTDTEYKSHYDHENRGQMNGMDPQQDELSYLRWYLPSNEDILMPSDPINIAPLDLEIVKKHVRRQLNNCPLGMRQTLREAYLAITTQYDRRGTELCEFEHLYNAFNTPPDSATPIHFPLFLLRLVAAQFVDKKTGKVKYEKIFPFMEMAAKKDPTATPSLQREREIRKIIEEVRLQLRDVPVDMTKMLAVFRNEDKGYRGTLSKQQIKDVLYRMNLQLTDSHMDKLIEMCRDSNNDGQYNWEEVSNYIGKAVMQPTGLNIPVSKRPLEYARALPVPVPSWPNPDSGGHHWRLAEGGRGMNSPPPPDPYTTVRDYSPRGRRDYSPNRGYDQIRERYEQRRDQFEDRRDGFENMRDDYERRRDMGMVSEAERRDMRDPYEDVRDRDFGPSHGRQSPTHYRDDLGPGSQINRRALEEKKRELAQNRVLLAEKDAKNKDWEKRWESAVKVMFDSAGVESGLQGVLPYKDCIYIMENLNRALNLTLEPNDILATAKRNECSKAGQVYIPQYLQLLKPKYTYT